VGFFSGQNCIKLDMQKTLTNSKPVSEYTPKLVAIPLKNMAFEDFTTHVNVGDVVKIGTKLATGNDHNKLPLFSSVSGTVTAIEKRDHISLKKTNHIIIENDFKDEKELLFDPVEDILSFTGDEIKKHMKDAGVLGLSGSGTPTFTKFRNTKNVTSILINAIEDEQFITADEYNITTYPALLAKGALTLLKAADAKECVIVIRESNKEGFEKLSAILGDFQEIKITKMPDIYPMGFERTLIKKIWDKTFKVLPIEAGVISTNVSTVIEFARTLTNALPLYERVITLAGDGFINQQNVKVRIGTILSDIVAEMGGYAAGVPKNARLVHGGPLRGSAVITDNLSVTPVTNGFVCIANAEHEQSPCSRCGACIRHCPAGLQPIQIIGAFKLKNKETLKQLGADKCIECGVCSFVCSSFIDVSDNAKKAKAFTLQK